MARVLLVLHAQLKSRSSLDLMLLFGLTFLSLFLFAKMINAINTLDVKKKDSLQVFKNNVTVPSILRIFYYVSFFRQKETELYKLKSSY